MKAYRGLQIYIFLTWALVGGEWSASRPGRFTPRGKSHEVGWTPEPVWTTWRRENSYTHWDSNSDPSVVQPVASRYTDYAIGIVLTVY
jgi:hypothetical protein